MTAPSAVAPGIAIGPGAPSVSSWSAASPGPGDQAWNESQFSIPAGYGEDRIVLLVKDPWWLYAYWEVQPSTERAARGQLLPQDIPGLQSVLRIYDVTGIDFPAQPAHRSFDIGLSGLATNWYIQTNAPGREFIVELGLLTAGGRFLLLVRSNRVMAPWFGPSDIIDENWLTTDEDYWKLFGPAAGIGVGSSPSAWAKLAPQHLFSPGWSSGSLWAPNRPAAIKGFWCRVNTDLIIHGATEPRSTVVVQGQSVAVRKDGSFSLRLALPEGTQAVTIDVTSPDGRSSRTVTPVITLAWTGALSPDGAKPNPQRSDMPRPQDLTPGSLP